MVLFFFSYLQFCYDKNKNENLIKKSIDKNFTIYLAREKMIINKKNYLQKKKDLIFFKESNKDLIKVIINSFSLSVKSARVDWEGIWNDRNIEEIFKCKSVLEKLMIANGQFLEKIVKNIIKILSPEKRSSLFEVGCGSGALLYLLKQI